MISRKNISQAVILAGGKGERLAKYSQQNLPKILTNVGSQSLLEDILTQLEKTNIKKVLFLLGYRSELIINKINDLKSYFNLEIDYLVESTPLGTGGSLINAYELGLLEEYILLLHGDLIIRLDIDNFIETFQKTLCDVLLLVHPSSHPKDSDLVEIFQDGRVKKIHCKPHAANFFTRNLCNAGIYAVHSKVLSLYDKNGKDLDRDILPNLVDSNFKVYSKRNLGFVRDMGTPKRLKEVKNAICKKSFFDKRPALFIDRDGTINIEDGLITSRQQIIVYEDAVRLIKFFNQLGYWVFVITNQSVIARGLIKRDELEEIHAFIDYQLSEQGVFVDDYFYCPHHPDAGFDGEVSQLKVKCSCRKPEPGLVELSVKKYDVDLQSSLVVGNSWRDRELAKNLKIPYFIVDRNKNSKMNDTISSLDEIVSFYQKSVLNYNGNCKK